jgi:hypothetical protein
LPPCHCTLTLPSRFSAHRYDSMLVVPGPNLQTPMSDNCPAQLGLFLPCFSMLLFLSQTNMAAPNHAPSVVAEDLPGSHNGNRPGTPGTSDKICCGHVHEDNAVTFDRGVNRPVEGILKMSRAAESERTIPKRRAIQTPTPEARPTTMPGAIEIHSTSPISTSISNSQPKFHSASQRAEGTVHSRAIAGAFITMVILAAIAMAWLAVWMFRRRKREPLRRIKSRGARGYQAAAIELEGGFRGTSCRRQRFLIGGDWNFRADAMESVPEVVIAELVSIWRYARRRYSCRFLLETKPREDAQTIIVSWTMASCTFLFFPPLSLFTIPIPASSILGG